MKNPKQLEDGVWYHDSSVVRLQAVAFVVGACFGAFVMMAIVLVERG